MHQPVKAKDKAKEKPAMTSFAKVAMMFRRFMDTLCGVSEDLLALGRRPSFYSLRARLLAKPLPGAAHQLWKPDFTSMK